MTSRALRAARTTPQQVLDAELHRVQRPRKTPLPAAYCALVAEAARLGWPRLWQEDLLVGDRDTILLQQAPCFGWTIREAGTYLFLPDHGGLELLRAHTPHAPPNAQVYQWKGVQLTATTWLALETWLKEQARALATPNGWYRTYSLTCPHRSGSDLTHTIPLTARSVLAKEIIGKGVRWLVEVDNKAYAFADQPWAEQMQRRIAEHIAMLQQYRVWP